MATFLVLTGMRERPLGEGVCLFQATGQQMRPPQRKSTKRLIDGRRLSHRLREQGHGVFDAPDHRVGLS